MDVEKGDSGAQELPLLRQSEKQENVQPEAVAKRPESAHLTRRFWVCAIINTLATAAIVFTNKHIFSHPSLRHAQVAFAAWHFALTSLLLHLASRPALGAYRLFPAKRATLRLILPIAAAMILNVVLPNAALAHSSIQFYQVARVLVTPAIVAVNVVLARGASSAFPAPRAAATLALTCVGVAVLSYFDTAKAAATTPGSGTSVLGVAFALAGVASTAVYTVWIKTFAAALDCSSWQLLLNQAPVSVLLMLYVIPFVDDVTAWRAVELPVWGLVGLSGAMACMINVSQFIIVEEAGPVTSSVVGHFKTCFIVALSWIVSRKALTPGTVLGVCLALGGIISYSYVTQRQSAR